MPKDCQMLLFSETFDDEVMKFAKTVVPDPIILWQRESLENIKQYYVVCRDKEDKLQALSNMFGVVSIGQCIVFCHVSVKKCFPRSPFFPFLLHFCSLSPNVPRPRKRALRSITFRGFPAKWRLRNERRNSILMTCHHLDPGSASEWSFPVGNLLQPIRSTTQTWVVTSHQYGISMLVSQTSFLGETRDALGKYWLFSLAKILVAVQTIFP